MDSRIPIIGYNPRHASKEIVKVVQELADRGYKVKEVDEVEDKVYLDGMAPLHKTMTQVLSQEMEMFASGRSSKHQAPIRSTKAERRSKNKVARKSRKKNR